MQLIWDADADGNILLPHLVGFSVAETITATVALQMRSADSQDAADLGGQRSQFSLTAESARELAAALLTVANALAPLERIHLN